MSNLDRFSQPLHSERLPSKGEMQEMIDEQNKLIHEDLVTSYIQEMALNHYRLPDAEEITEYYYQVDLDQRMVKEKVKEASQWYEVSII
jgi:hypothetical protein